MLKFVLEIKNRFILLILTWTFTFITSYFYKEVLLFSITQLHNSSTTFYFIFTSITEIFSVYIKLTVFLSFQVISLYAVYHFFLFFVPATFKFEYRYLSKILQMVIGLWVFVTLFVHFFLVPLTWNFFLSFFSSTSAHSINLHFEARLSEYLSFYIEIYYVCIFSLQIFMILFFFFSYNKINENYIKKFRKLYYYLFILISTILSPPDILSQIVISFFIICAYEILLINILFKKII